LLDYILLLPASSLDASVPATGSAAGSETITLLGRNFITPTVTVQFSNSTVGGCPSAPVTLTGVVPVNFTQIVIQTPSWPCGPGVANLAVLTNRQGLNFATPPVPFVFYAPNFAVTAFAASSPSGGPLLGGTAVTLIGTSLVSTPNALCKFGYLSSPLTVINSTTGSCTSPKVTTAQDAPFRIALNGVNFTSTGPTFYYYNVAGLTLDVPRGPATGSTLIYIRLTSTGSVSHPGNVAIVRFASSVNGAISDAVPGTVVADTNAPSGFSILTLSPDSTPYSFLYPTTFTLTISLNGGQQFLPPVVAFEYYNDPAVSGLSSLSGIPADNAAGLVVTITGSNFRNYPLSYCKVTMLGTVVTVPATYGSSGGGVLLVTMPSLAGASVAGPAVFEISLNDGRQYTSNGKSLTLFVVSGVAPAGGPLAGGTALTVAGAGFTPTSILCKVGVGGTPSQANFVSSTAITCSAPPGLAVGPTPVMASMDAVRFSSPAAAQFIYFERSIFERLDPALGSSNATASSMITVVGRSFPVLGGGAGQMPLWYGGQGGELEF
jgi:hypothetical protein